MNTHISIIVFIFCCFLMYNIYFCLLFLVICWNHTFVVRSGPLLLFGILESIRHISPKHLDASGGVKGLSHHRVRLCVIWGSITLRTFCPKNQVTLWLTAYAIMYRNNWNSIAGFDVLSWEKMAAGSDPLILVNYRPQIVIRVTTYLCIRRYLRQTSN